MVKRPEEYRWSSYHANAWADACEIVTPHRETLRLGDTISERNFRYRDLFKYSLSNEDLHSFRKAAYYCIPIGSDKFCKQIEDKIACKTANIDG